MEPEASTEPPQSTDYTYLYDRLTTLKTHQASITRDIASIEYKLGISKDARTEWKCLRCHHRWQGGSLPPTRCQRCKSPCWFKAPRTMRDRHPEDKPAKSWYKPTGRPRGRPPGTPNKRVYFATPVEVPTQPGPSQLPPLDLPRLGNAPAARAPANLAASAASLPPLPAPSVPLPAPTYEYHLY
jgi:DNA-directed RNA polymerase subunit RPC12/RpoP